MDFLHIDPRELFQNPWNTNVVAPSEMEKLKASLSRHGWVRPVMVRETDFGHEILGGQHRVEAAIELGHETVPVVNLGRISDQKAKEVGLIDNARYGQDDALGLAELLKDLGGAKAMAEFLPIGDEELASLSTDFDDDDIEDLLNDDEGDEDAPEPSKPTKTHQIMRFKVPLSDADNVTDFFERVMREQGFDEADSLTNAGDALVWLVNDMNNGESA